MKFSSALSALVFLLPLVSPAAAQFAAQGRGRNGNNNNNNGNNNNGNNNNGNNNNGNNNNGNNNNQDPQTSLTLNPAVIAQGFASNGQDPPVAGQVPSLTSTNNFINFCLTAAPLPITDGRQITTGSCNPAPIGVIPSVERMPSSKFVNPRNGGTVAIRQPFQIQMAINNLETGNFVNAQANYFAAPQQLNNAGIIRGHSHVVVERLESLDQTTPTNPQQFAFFKGLNGVANNGILTADVTEGLDAGAYRLCSINTSSNHQPAIVPVAQHGALDDCVYFTVTNDNNNNNNQNGGNNNNNNQNGGNNNNNNQNGGNNNNQNGGNNNNQNGGNNNNQNGGNNNNQNGGNNNNNNNQNGGNNNNNQGRGGFGRGGFNNGGFGRGGSSRGGFNRGNNNQGRRGLGARAQL